MGDLTDEAWYHGRISRADAERVLDNVRLQSGSFLVRDSLTTTGEYVLSLLHEGRKYHYLMQRNQDGSVSIQDGAKFNGPIELVQYYSSHVDGLLTMLRQPCSRRHGEPPRGYRFISQEEMHKAMREAALLLGYQESQVKDAVIKRRGAFEQLVGGILHRKQLWFHGPITREESEGRMKVYGLRDGLFLMRERTKVNSFALVVSYQNVIYHYLLDMNTLGQLSIENGRKFENLLQVVDHYSRTADGLLCVLTDLCPVNLFQGEGVVVQPQVVHGPRRIDDSEIITQAELGAGTFGTVRAGIYKPKNGQPEVKCALKCLKPTEELPNQSSEILREADAMVNLDHPNVVKLFGIVVGNPIRLVMELASQGPLNKYLRRHPNFAPHKTMNFVLQVAKGMEYLEKSRFVHRDLAARNVLVVDEDNVKISDFGMSRAIGGGSEYYKAETAGRWPLKWYAPECIYYAKFDSKSDVWSYGVTTWEAFSYGSRPYQGLRGQEIMSMLESNERLECPEKCPTPVYDVMIRTWSWRPEDRPSFAELVKIMSDLYTFLNPPVRPPRAPAPKPGFRPMIK